TPPRASRHSTSAPYRTPSGRIAEATPPLRGPATVAGGWRGGARSWAARSGMARSPGDTTVAEAPIRWCCHRAGLGGYLLADLRTRRGHRLVGRAQTRGDINRWTAADSPQPVEHRGEEQHDRQRAHRRGREQLGKDFRHAGADGEERAG